MSITDSSDLDPGSGTSSSSSTDSSSSSSSTDSSQQSSASKRSRSGLAVAAVPLAQPEVPDIPDAADVAANEGAARPRDDGRPNLSRRWGVFAVTYRGSLDTRLTIEVKCPHPWHPARTVTSRCGRSRTLKVADVAQQQTELDLLLRSLKQWCLQGLSLHSKHEHMQLEIDARTLPSMAELDSALENAQFPE